MYVYIYVIWFLTIYFRLFVNLYVYSYIYIYIYIYREMLKSSEPTQEKNNVTFEFLLILFIVRKGFKEKLKNGASVVFQLRNKYSLWHLLSNCQIHFVVNFYTIL